LTLIVLGQFDKVQKLPKPNAINPNSIEIVDYDLLLDFLTDKQLTKNEA